MCKYLQADIGFHCRKARNKHIHELRTMAFSNTHSLQIAKHVLEKDSCDETGVNQDMQVMPMFQGTMPTPNDMCALLMSSKMHADTVFYKRFVDMMGSGKLCKIPKQRGTTPMSEYLSVNHEAHFRLELWYCLGKQGLPQIQLQQSPSLSSSLISRSDGGGPHGRRQSPPLPSTLISRLGSGPHGENLLHFLPLTTLLLFFCLLF